MVRKKLYKFIAMILTGSVLLTQPGVVQMAGTVPVYAEEAAEQVEDSGAAQQTDDAAETASEEAQNEENGPEEETAPEETAGEEQTEESKESMDSEVPSGSSSESEDQKENPDEKKDEEEASKYTGMSDEEFLASIVYDLGEAVDNGDSPSPEKITAAIGQFIASLDKIIGKKPAGSDLLQELLADANGIGMGANAVIAFLKISGLMQDPTAVALSDIKNILEVQNTKLREISDTLKNLAAKLDDIQYKQDLHERKEAAVFFQEKFDQFESNQVKKLQDAIDNYNNAVSTYLSNWAYQKGAITPAVTSLAAYFTVIVDGETKKIVQAYSRANENKTTVKKSDDGKNIYPRFTIELPIEYVREALSNYAENVPAPLNITSLITYLKEAVIEAANEEQLIVGEESCFYSDWNTYTDGNKEKKAQEIAEALYNNQAYWISADYSDIMADNGEINQLKLDYVDLCNVMLKNNSGLNAYYSSLTNLYAFEGQISEELQTTVSRYCAILGYYGLFIMTLMRQSSSQLGSINTIQKYWTDYSEYLDEYPKKQLKNIKNYCYITDSIISGDTREISAETTFYTTEYERDRWFKTRQYIRWDRTDVKPIKIQNNDKKIVNTNDIRMIYGVYNAFSNIKTESFKDFLGKYDITYSGDVLTTSIESGPFSLINNIPMKAYKGQYNHDWSMYGGYSEGNTFLIADKNLNSSKWDAHDSVVGDTVTINEKGITPDKKTVFARAAFSDHRRAWEKDHIWYFSDSKTEIKREVIGLQTDERLTKFISKGTISTLNSTSVEKNLNITGECEDEICIDALDHMIAKREESDMITDISSETDVIPKKTANEWNSYELSLLQTDSSDEEVKEFFYSYVDEIAYNGINGTQIKLTTQQKETIVKAILNKNDKVWKDYSENENMNYTSYIDPFHIYGNKAIMTSLAKTVLSDQYKTEEGEPIIPYENMITVSYLEPLPSLTFAKNNGKLKAVLSSVLNVEPYLIIWDNTVDVYKKFKITNEVMTSLGLTMNVRLSAASLGDSTKAKVIHYDDYDTMNEVERFTVDVQGSGNNRYVEVKVASCSPFAVASASAQGEDADDDNNGGSGNNGSKGNGSSSGSSSAKGGTSSGSSAKGVSSVKTGDTTNVVPYIILFLIAAACLGGIVIYRRKKQ